MASTTSRLIMLFLLVVSRTSLLPEFLLFKIKPHFYIYFETRLSLSPGEVVESVIVNFITRKQKFSRTHIFFIAFSSILI